MELGQHQPDPERAAQTLNYALSQVVNGGVTRAGAAAAGMVVMMIVPIIMFLVTQSNIIETMSTSGMKD